MDAARCMVRFEDVGYTDAILVVRSNPVLKLKQFLMVWDIFI